MYNKGKTFVTNSEHHYRHGRCLCSFWAVLILIKWIYVKANARRSRSGWWIMIRRGCFHRNSHSHPFLSFCCKWPCVTAYDFNVKQRHWYSLTCSTSHLCAADESGSDEDFMVEDDDDSDYGHSKKRSKKVIRRGRPDKKEKKSPKPRLKATGQSSRASGIQL